MKKSLKIFNVILVYGFLILGILLVFGLLERASAIFFAFSSFIVSILVALFLKHRRIDEKYWLLINIGLWLNVLGEIEFYYSGFLDYDKVLHFFIGLMLTVMVYDYYQKNSRLGREAVLLTVVGMLGGWEIYEYLTDIAFGFVAQGVIRDNVFVMSRLDDTMWDMILGTIAASIYLLYKKLRFDQVVKKKIKKPQIKIVNPYSFLKEAIKTLKWP